MVQRSFLRQRVCFVVFTLAVLQLHFASADAPRVRFDIASTIACRDATPENLDGRRLVEARFQVSSLIERGDEKDLIQYFYRIESPQRTMQVVEYAPKTTLASDIANNMIIEEKEEKTKGIGIGLSGTHEYLLKATGSADMGSKKTSSVRFEKLPPLELLSSSGTINRGTGVYYKLKPSSRTSLEGGKEFALVLEVPDSWRCDIVLVRCRAAGYRRGVVSTLDQERLSGSQDFLIALHREGDDEARAAATHFVEAKSHLWQVVGRHRSSIKDRAYPTVAHKFGAALDAVDPKIPANWLNELISDFEAREPPFHHLLPSPVQRAVSEFVESRRVVLEMSGVGRLAQMPQQ